MEVEFKAFPKIPRGKTNVVTISEKIDGSNGCLIILQGALVGVQSRNRLIRPGDDNMGFAFWAYDNKEELERLGDGYHYGEWAGPGIQKNPHNLEEKTFFLFNTFRHTEQEAEGSLPKQVKVVPVLYNGPYRPEAVEEAMVGLQEAARMLGYKPEGVVVYFHDSRSYTKHTFENSEGKWKSQLKEAANGV